jgi:hypothetical protein
MAWFSNECSDPLQLGVKLLHSSKEAVLPALHGQAAGSAFAIRCETKRTAERAMSCCRSGGPCQRLRVDMFPDGRQLAVSNGEKLESEALIRVLAPGFIDYGLLMVSLIHRA